MGVSDRHDSIRVNGAHTRIPNKLLDLVYPRLSPSEQACMTYIMRRTYGWASPGDSGGRKLWDRISVSQFVDGSQSGGYVMDLGTGVKRTSVINALDKLEERGLVRVSYECPTVRKGNKTTGCGWSEAEEEGSASPLFVTKTNNWACPRCGKTLSKAYSLRSLTPGWIHRFLTATDPLARVWGYDAEVGQFYIVEAAKKPQKKATVSSAALRKKLWYPDMIDEIVEQAAALLGGGVMQDGRIANGFYKPIISLQEAGVDKAVLQDALVITRDKKIATEPHNRNWHRYVAAICNNSVARSDGRIESGWQSLVTDELERAADLNANGEHEHAQQLLYQLVDTHLDALTEELDGDREAARSCLFEAFKKGISDWRAPGEYDAYVDYLPTWTIPVKLPASE